TAGPGRVRAGLADHDSQLHLPVDLAADRRIDRDVVVRTGDACDRLGEDGRRLDIATNRGFLSVLLVVAAHGHYVSARRVDRRKEDDVFERDTALRAGGGFA